jgi:disulfide bond formation protein DsbB
MQYKIRESSMYLGFTVALIGVLGSLYFSEVLGLIPCVLCWYQRIALFPLAVIFAVGIIRHSKEAWFYAWPLMILGWIIGLYNVLLVYGVVQESQAICKAGVSCATVTWSMFGFINIPLLSFLAFNFLISLAIVNYKD